MGRLLALIIVSEVMILLAVFGLLYLIRGEVGTKPENQAGQHEERRPLVVLADLESVISSDLPGAGSWLSKRWLQNELRDALRRIATLEIVEQQPQPLPAVRPCFRLELHLLLDNQHVPPLVASSAVPAALVKLVVTSRLKSFPAPGQVVEVFEGRAAREVRCSIRAEDGPSTHSAVQRLIFEGVQEALEQAQAQANLGSRSLAELVAEARSGGSSGRVAALRVLGTRMDDEALAPLLEALRDESQDVVLAAVGALIARRDPAALPGLIDSTRGRNLDYLSQVLFAVASIGGPEADAYLDTMVNGHQNAEIRARAVEALREMRARQAKETEQRTPPAP